MDIFLFIVLLIFFIIVNLGFFLLPLNLFEIITFILMDIVIGFRIYKIWKDEDYWNIE